MFSSLALAMAMAFPVAGMGKHSFAVTVTGSGPAVLLIPGLMCCGDVWQATVDHLKGHYQCHVFTLPGFAGQPAIKPPMLTTVKDEIEAYVEEAKLDRPAIIGHSLGGMLALWLASDRPAMFGGVISVDGVPYLGALQDPKQTPATALPAAAALKKYFSTMKAAEFSATNARSLPMMITDPANVKFVSADANRSDPAAVGDAVSEMLATDLRPNMGRVSCPLLMIVPGGDGDDAQLKSISERYEAQIAVAPQHQIVVIPKARHFVMLDQPEALYREIDSFLPRIIRRD